MTELEELGKGRSFAALRNSKSYRDREERELLLEFLDLSRILSLRLGTKSSSSAGAAMGRIIMILFCATSFS